MRENKVFNALVCVCVCVCVPYVVVVKALLLDVVVEQYCTGPVPSKATN